MVTLLATLILSLVYRSSAFKVTCTRPRGIIAAAVIKNTYNSETASAVNCTAEEPCFLPFASVTTVNPTKVSINFELHFQEPVYRKNGTGALVPVTKNDAAFLQDIAYVVQKSVQSGEVLANATLGAPYIPPTTQYYLSVGLASQTGFDVCNTCIDYPDVTDYVLKVVVRGESLFRADGSAVCSMLPPRTRKHE